MPPKLPRKASNSATNAGSHPVTCSGCNDTLQKKEALNCSACKVWLHCYCAGVPKSRFSNISNSFLCIPCSLVVNNTVLEAVNKRLETVSSGQVQNLRESTKCSMVVKRNSRRNSQGGRTTSNNQEGHSDAPRRSSHSTEKS